MDDISAGRSAAGVTSDRTEMTVARNPDRPRRRLTTETKSSFKTTEFWVYIAAVVGVFIASALVGTTQNHTDYFRADRAWLYIVILTVGYLGSRGWAKSGSRQAYDE